MNLLGMVWQALMTCLRNPGQTVIAVVIVWGWAELGLARVAGCIGLVLVAALVWRLAHRASYHRLIGGPCRRWWRLRFRYRRYWPAAMTTCGPTKRYQGVEYIPRLRKLHCTPYTDVVHVPLLSGQAPEMYEAVTGQLAHTFGALSCHVRVAGPGRVWLEFAHGDPLVEPIPALPVPESFTPDDLVIGRREDGSPWVLSGIGTHLLIAGATGSGKGSVLWSLLRALGVGIRDGLVEIWAIDPKGGMELAFGEPLYHRFAYRTTADMVDLFEEAVAVMRERQSRMVGVTRQHTPTPDDPLMVVLVDELAALIAYVDRDTRRRAADALQISLSQGRAVGVHVVAALQDPGKDVLPFRDLFPTRIALRMLEPIQVDMVLSKSARDRGAACDRIPASLPGVGYVWMEGVREPVRVRASYVSDEEINELATGYAPRVDRVDLPEVVDGPADLGEQAA